MRRGQVMLLALLAFALPTAVFANNIEFETGTFEHGTITSFGKHFRVQLVGSLDTITLSIPHLTCSATECSFRSGTVTVVNSAGVTVFRDGLMPGELPIRTGPMAQIAVYLLPDSLGGGGYTKFDIKFRHHTILAGDAETYAAPEPGALEGLLLGTGLLGLTEMARRKVRLGLGT